MELRGKVALVTGAARRVGRAIVLELAASGCDVAIHYHRSADEAGATARDAEGLGRRVLVIQGNLEDPDCPAKLISAVVGQYGRLDILVNNASLFEPSPMNWDDAHWTRTFRVNVLAPAALIRAAAQPMRQGGAGCVVNLADILAERPSRQYAAYCASKAALVNLTRSMARELAPTIRVNAVAPGIAVFPPDYDQATRERLVQRVPLGREGSPEQIAQAVRFICTADYMTGQVLTIDGGRSIVP